DQMKRTQEELVSYVYRECSFPHGALIMTGTGIVPSHEFTLASGDEIRISIGHIGTLINYVAQALRGNLLVRRLLIRRASAHVCKKRIMTLIDGVVDWGIIGCGDVGEVKSGPAFSKVATSNLVAVMRRDVVKAADFARRHGVSRYYGDADQLIGDNEVNAIYIATPPVYHEEYAFRAMKAGKPVYIEKPVTLNSASCERM